MLDTLYTYIHTLEYYLLAPINKYFFLFTFCIGSGAPAAWAVWAVTVAAAWGVAIMADPIPRPAEPG